MGCKCKNFTELCIKIRRDHMYPKSHLKHLMVANWVRVEEEMERDLGIQEEALAKTDCTVKGEIFLSLLLSFTFFFLPFLCVMERLLYVSQVAGEKH